MVLNLKRIDEQWFQAGNYVMVPARDVVQFSIEVIQRSAEKKRKAEKKLRKKGEEMTSYSELSDEKLLEQLNKTAQALCARGYYMQAIVTLEKGEK